MASLESSPLLSCPPPCRTLQHRWLNVARPGTTLWWDGVGFHWRKKSMAWRTGPTVLVNILHFLHYLCNIFRNQCHGLYFCTWTSWVPVPVSRTVRMNWKHGTGNTQSSEGALMKREVTKWSSPSSSFWSLTYNVMGDMRPGEPPCWDLRKI